MTNVVLVLLDDAGAGDAGVLGHPILRTPHIDAFARSGVRFSAAYAGAPNCSPSRAALLTGRAPFRTGVYDFLSKRSGSMHLAAGETTIAALLRASGYQTLHLGKWHLSRRGAGHGFAPPHFGFDHSNESYAPASQLVAAFGGWLRGGRRRGAPFFAYLALWEPHEPVQLWSPPAFRRLYEGSGGDASGGGDSISGDADLAARGRQHPAGGGRCVWRVARAPPRVYYGCLSAVDTAIGRLLSELGAAGVREDTLVALASDNGPEHRGRHSWGSSGGLRGAKGYVYEGGIRVPLFLQWPAFTRGRSATVQTPVHLWDLLPTLVEAAGVPLDADTRGELDGVSLLPLAAAALAGDERSTRPLGRRRPLWWAMHRGRGGMQYALREGEWKLLAGYGDTPSRSHGPAPGGEVTEWLRACELGRAELYRVSHDPTEAR